MGAGPYDVYPVQQQHHQQQLPNSAPIMQDQLHGNPSGESHESGGTHGSSAYSSHGGAYSGGGGGSRSTRSGSIGGASVGTSHSGSASVGAGGGAGPSLHLTATIGGGAAPSSYGSYTNNATSAHNTSGISTSINVNNVTTSSSSTVTAGNVTLPSAAAGGGGGARHHQHNSYQPTGTTQDANATTTAGVSVGGFAAPPGFLSPISTDARSLGASTTTGGGGMSSLQRAAAAASSSRYGSGGGPGNATATSDRAQPQSQRYGGGGGSGFGGSSGSSSYNPSAGGSVPGLAPSSSLSASSASYTYGGGSSAHQYSASQPRTSSRGRGNERPLYQPRQQGSLSGLGRLGQYGSSSSQQQTQGYGDDRSTYSAYSSRSQYSQPSAYSYPSQGAGGGSVRGGYDQMYADHDAPSSSTTFGTRDQQRGSSFQPYANQGGSRSVASGYSNAAGSTSSASSAVDAMKLLLNSPPPVPPMQSSVLPPSSSSVLGGAGSGQGIPGLPPPRGDQSGGDAPWLRDSTLKGFDKSRSSHDQSIDRRHESSGIALPSSPPHLPNSFSGSATDKKPILPAHDEPDNSGSEYAWDEDDEDESEFDEHDREFHRAAYGHASAQAMVVRGRKKISPRTKKREWLLRMNRRLIEVPVGELDPAAVPISAIMNGWAKTKSSEGAAMVEM